jgi:hypothetical protein
VRRIGLERTLDQRERLAGDATLLRRERVGVVGEKAGIVGRSATARSKALTASSLRWSA